MKHKHLILFAIGLLWAGFANAQQSVNCTGGNATGSGGSVSYSVGQIEYTSHTGSAGSVSQGVQQPYEIITVGEQQSELQISLVAFPNPTADVLTLQISDFKDENLSFQLFDVQGKLLNDGKIVGTQTNLNTLNLNPATYYLNVLNQNNKTIQSFQIIKN